MSKTRIGRSTRISCLAAAILLVVGATPAQAATGGTYADGVFEDTHISNLLSGQQSPPCVDYSDWRSVGQLPPSAVVASNQVTVDNGTNSLPYDGPIATVTQSDPGVVWREGPPGTYAANSNCSSPGAIISGFTADITGETADKKILCYGGANAVSTNDTYTRGLPDGTDGTVIQLVFHNYTCEVTDKTSNNTKVTDETVLITFDMVLYVGGIHVCSTPIAPHACLASGKVTFA